MSRTMVREVVPTIFDVNGLHGEIILSTMVVIIQDMSNYLSAMGYLYPQ